MKKKIIIVLTIFLVVIISFVFYKNHKVNQEKKIHARYIEIKNNVKKAVERNISIMYPSCSISAEFKETEAHNSHYNSWFLINNGYIEKNELLDIDNVSYCDVYVKYFEGSLDQQHNCEISYKVYLKCKDYEDEGYINWG